jgi:hypothetical protein
MVIFHSYVNLPEDNIINMMTSMGLLSLSFHLVETRDASGGESKVVQNIQRLGWFSECYVRVVSNSWIIFRSPIYKGCHFGWYNPL